MRNAFIMMWVVWPGLALAQTQITFEYRPAAGVTVQVVVESRGERLMMGVPGVIDGTVVEFTSLGGITTRVIPAGGGNFGLEVRYDSLRARYRMGTGTWSEGQLAFNSPVEALFTTDRRLALGAPAFVGDATVGEGARSGTGRPHLVLPVNPVDVAGQWQSELHLPFSSEIPGEGAGIVTATLTGPAVGLLDSLVFRGADTLAYLSARGRFNPSTATSTLMLGGGPATAELWGEFAGKFIWSTAWNAFVSAAVAARVSQRFEAVVGSGVEDARVTTTVTTRVRVRT
jgi:hypothetical protein